MVACRMQLGRLACWCAIAVACLGGQVLAVPPAPPAVPPPDELTDAQVVASIERGMNYLMADLDVRLKPIKDAPQLDRGDPRIMNGDVGELLLEAYALLHVGQDLKDQRMLMQTERVKLLIDVLTRFESESNYHTAVQTLALSQLPQTPEIKRAINQTTTRLINGRVKTGGYGYVLNPNADIHDQSNTQYAMLAVWAAADFGVNVPAKYWTSMNEFWRRIQLPNGGWGYGGIPDAAALQQAPRDSMTAAGLASLYVCDEFLNRAPRSTAHDDPATEKAMAAMVNGLDLESNDFYYLYGVERVALASGRKFFGKKDWYRPMAVNVMKRQNPDGSFDSKFTGANLPRSTCYAILLLARGRAPVLMNKLEYDGSWNMRPRDSANVHAQVARTLERHMNWQSVPLDTPVQQWQDAPILLITGSKDPNFTPEDVIKLRQYVQSGGIIFSSSDLESEEFTAAMKKYARQMLEPTAPETAFRELPADHLLFKVSGRMENPPKLFGVSNGLRELWIHSPTDYGAIWQSRTMNPPEAWELPVMLFSYAAGKEELRSKLQTLSVPPPKVIPSRRATVALLAWNGNWNPEPGAWPRLAKLIGAAGVADVTVAEILTTGLNKMPQMPAMAHLAGTGKLLLTDDEKKALKEYVIKGGTLFVEALGGDADFAKSAAEMLKEIFPEGTPKLVPPDYTLFLGDFSTLAVKIRNVKYRRYWVLEHGAQAAPRLEYLTVNHRVGVFISGEDITSGLLGMDTWGINGYMPDSAVAIAWNMVLYAARNAPKPKPAPASQPGGAAASGK